MKKNILLAIFTLPFGAICAIASASSPEEVYIIAKFSPVGAVQCLKTTRTKCDDDGTSICKIAINVRQGSAFLTTHAATFGEPYFVFKSGCELILTNSNSVEEFVTVRDEDRLPYALLNSLDDE